MSDGLRVAVVGCGRMGEQRARAAAALGAFVVLCDADPAHAAALAAALPTAAEVCEGAPPMASVDAVFVCTPPSERGPVELAAARSGTAVFVEKPIGVSASRVRAAVEAVVASGVVNGAGYMNRYRPSVAAARERLAGAEVFAVDCRWVGNAYAKSWWLDPARSGGPFNDQAGHLLDVCRYVAGEITEVAGVSSPASDTDRADTVAASLRLAGGGCGSLLYSYRARDKFVVASFFTADGCVALEGWDFRAPTAAGAAREPDRDGITPIFLTETRAFLDAVRSGERSSVRCDIGDAHRTQQVADAVRRALATGRREAVEPPLR